jgi:hypothetical protein
MKRTQNDNNDTMSKRLRPTNTNEQFDKVEKERILN